MVACELICYYTFSYQMIGRVVCRLTVFALILKTVLEHDAFLILRYQCLLSHRMMMQSLHSRKHPVNTSDDIYLSLRICTDYS